MVEFKPEEYEFNDSDHVSDSDSSTNIPEITIKRNHEETNEDIPANSAKKSRNDLYKQPTAEEMNKLRETENLFNSNIFRLQINELLEEVKIKPKYQSQLDTWYQEFENELKNIPEFTEFNLMTLSADAKKKKHDNRQKFIKFASTIKKVDCSSNVSMKLMKPQKVTLLSSLKHIHNDKTKLIGNIMLTMNKQTFYEKDYLNNRYALMKQFYMVYIQYHIQNLDIIKSVKIVNYQHNPHLPILEVVPAQYETIKVHIFIVPESDTFKLGRFLPNKNNIKKLSFSDFPEFNLEPFANNGTYLYNAVMLFDCTLEANDLFFKCLSDHENIKDAIKLVIIWLQQRELNNHYCSFTNDLAVYFITYLFTKKKINKLMSSYQVVRIFWSFIANLKADEKLSIAIDVKPNDLTLFEDPFVLLDCTGHYNVASFLDKNIYLKLKTESKTAIESLDSNQFNSFSNLFMVKMPVGLQYDAILKIVDVNRFKKIYCNCTDTDKFKYFGFYMLLIGNLIEKHLIYGLTNRIHEIIPIYSENLNIITYGINLNPANCYNVIEKGPRQYETGAEEFKAFWGELADLRRFKDSSIYEAVYFNEVKTIQDKRLIFAKIIKFVMEEKLQISYELTGTEMECMLNSDHIEKPFPSGSNEEAILKIKGVQTELDKILRNLKLPLPITACQCTSDVYSYTDLFPPVPTNYNLKRDNCSERGDFVVINGVSQKMPHLFEPIECVLQLALNSKWPKTIEALRAMKTIYYFEVSKLLRTEHDVISSVRDDFIDVFFCGYVFRLRLHHPKEIVLLKKDATADGMTFYKDTEESLSLERDLDVLPKISGALNGLHRENPSYGPSTCLIKRWLRAQMLDAYHISDVVINLLNASLFVNSAPYRPAILPQVAFLRFLNFISNFDPNFQTIAVNFNGTMSTDELNDIDGKFLQNRQTYNALHIITPYDEGKSVFTKHAPTAMVLRRIKNLATETYKIIGKHIQENSKLSYRSWFKPNLSGYDVLIHLNASTNVQKYQQVNRGQRFVVKIEEYSNTQTKCLPVVGFNPVQLYLKELRANYGEYALFFHDTYGGNVIGVLWKQNMQKDIQFKISSVHGRKPTKENKLEISTCINDFYIHGKDIVKDIEILNKLI